MVNLEQLSAAFKSRYGRTPRLFSAPGRVNLIGEHTDYNDGFVLPMAIERRTYVAAALRDDDRIVAQSSGLNAHFTFELGQAPVHQRGSWADYIEGTARALAARGFAIPGADILIDSDVPSGAGLSASAALELSVGFALASLGGSSRPDRVQLALGGQAAEHEYVGTLCGIMDQYISSLGQAGHALLIDCRTLEPTPVPVSLGDTRVVICDTRVKHQLASSEYNKRRVECQTGVAALSARLPLIRALRDVSLQQLEEHASLLSEVVLRRCRHVVTENARTLEAAQALGRADLVTMGKLMVESHRSLRDDYEVSCQELDLAVDVALGVPGVYGSRMTGGGFGGCTVTLVEKSAIDSLTTAVSSAFRDAFGTNPELFASRACEGVREEP
ncbi:MAG TPA: galactokinase [Polyangiaceae bacterium]|nr:galactokinase [Polyangiaceae bacterium]